LLKPTATTILVEAWNEKPGRTQADVPKLIDSRWRLADRSGARA
jgi:hypothetical protein